MLPRADLVAEVAGLPTAAFADVAFRVMLARYAPTELSRIGSLRTGGRFNGPGRFEALYLASSPLTARQEVDALAQTAEGLRGVQGPPRILLSVECHLQAIVDLTASSAWPPLGTTLDELCAPWRPANALGALAPAQGLGELIYQRGIEGVRAPSAHDRSSPNLVVFPHRLLPGSTVRVFDDSGLIDAHLP